MKEDELLESIKENELPLIEDVIFQLEEISGNLDVPLKEVFKAAAASELEIIFKVPFHYPRLVLRPRGREPKTGEPNFLRLPDYLVLGHDACQQLLNGDAVVYHSTLGYRARDKNSRLVVLSPGDAGTELFPVMVDGEKFAPSNDRFGFWGTWSFWGDSGAISHSVRREDVFVRKQEFAKWRLEYYYPRHGLGAGKKPESKYSLLSRECVDDDFKSPQLLWMCEAARLFWFNESIIPNEGDTYPSAKKIVAWFMDREDGSFNKTSAEHAAKLIKPSFARGSNRD